MQVCLISNSDVDSQGIITSEILISPLQSYVGVPQSRS
jgi:hypothetical protein